MNKKIYKLIVLAGVFFPAFTFAQAVSFRDAVKNVTGIVKGSLIPLLFSAALAYFIWGVGNFIRNADNPDERKKGKQQILWGVIALAVMVTYFSLTSIFTNSFFGTGAALPQLFEG